MVMCCICNKSIHSKPWMSVMTITSPAHVCSYICSNQIDRVVGKGYGDQIINKEDFLGIVLPISNYGRISEDTTDLDKDEIMEEIRKEEARILEIERAWNESDTSSDEENNR